MISFFEKYRNRVKGISYYESLYSFFHKYDIVAESPVSPTKNGNANPLFLSQSNRTWIIESGPYSLKDFGTQPINRLFVCNCVINRIRLSKYLLSNSL